MVIFRFLLPSKNRSLATLPDLHSKQLSRREPCRLCGEKIGFKVARLCYWDLAEADLVTCPKCRLAQLDPMLTAKTMTTGVYAHYLMQRAGESEKSYRRNCARNFRKGFAFAKSLPKGLNPKNILELGPGDGHFLKGIRSVFPGAAYYAWDLVPEVARAMRDEHGFLPLSGGFEKLKTRERFDLIVARDVIEHFAEVGDVLRQVVKLLNPGGLFHFITPNGHEDIWKFYVAGRLHGANAPELLLNHVNYFDGGGLDRYLQKLGLTKEQCYIYDFSSLKLGLGWKISEHLGAKALGLSAKLTIKKLQHTEAVKVVHRASLSQPGFWEKLWYRYKYWKAIKLPARWNFGHEIHGLYRKAFR